MNKKWIVYIILTLIGIMSLPLSIYAESKDIIKVGYYEHWPYYFMNEQGKIDGYYSEVLDVLAKELDFEYSYVKGDLNYIVDQLVEGEIDLAFGINYTKERAEKVLYTDYYIHSEDYSIYMKNTTNPKQDLFKVAIVEGDLNTELMMNYLEERIGNIECIYVRSYKALDELFDMNEMDLIVADNIDRELKTYKKVHEYSMGPVYIVANPNKAELVDKVNNILEKTYMLQSGELLQIDNKYFKASSGIYKYFKIYIVSFMTLCILIIMIWNGEIKKKYNQYKIRKRILENEYLLYYQPIVNPNNNKIIGFEALARFRHPKKGIVAPKEFIGEIENNGMSSEFAIWGLKQVISDYRIIKQYKKVVDKTFYISLNISVKELEEPRVVEQIKTILEEEKVMPQTICLEIVEGIKIHQSEQITQTIKELKSYGMKIAIDDFGVEYSNLDRLAKIEFDIIKIDKYFIDEMNHSPANEEIIKFISKLAMIIDKGIIAEGVEWSWQKEMINQLNNKRFYIQGYLYSRPIPVQEINQLKIV